MTHKHHDELPQAEQQAFLLACRTHGGSPTDFHVMWEEVYPDHGDVDHVERFVTVRAIHTESEPVTYDAGPGTDWIDGFAADLAAGTFDPQGIEPLPTH